MEDLTDLFTYFSDGEECEDDVQPINDESMRNLEQFVKICDKNNCIKVLTLGTTDGCIHEVALPPDAEYVSLKDQPFIRTFPFNLDPFQRKAMECINNRQSVLVSAHTSSGKTAVAEYSIAMALANKQRVIYTTPIKALSNQKYREFEVKFEGDVGLVTGDVTLNFEASCLIMTTEILRNMLYRGSKLMREVAWVIFDEIHYMRDKERGVVWEESLILLPDGIRAVFLSATVPNARQFAEWVAFLHHQPCHVIYTDVRPTPLEHYLFPSGDSSMHLVVDKFGNFKQENFDRAVSFLAKPDEEFDVTAAPKRKRICAADTGKKCCELLKFLMKQQYAPVIVFSFSKKECEFYAIGMAKDCSVTEDVKRAITEIFYNAIENLSPSDRQLPQIESLLSFLKKGIGIHHGGLLPILKEIVEILFSEGLLACLFATETFAMGLNMPARTVLFTACRKFDGKEMRFITSGEYIQMSGRAGRRGLDEKGTVIMMIEESVTPEQIKTITQGQADSLTSAFHLTYNMILNLMRVEEINPEYMLEKSFHQFQSQGNIPQIYAEFSKVQQELDNIKVPNELKVAEYYHLRKKLDELADEFRSHTNKADVVVNYMQPGRLIKLLYNERTDWGMVLSYSKQWTPDRAYYLNMDVLLCSKEPTDSNELPVMEIITIKNTDIRQVSSIKLKHPVDLRSVESKIKVYHMMKEVKNRFNDDLPMIHPFLHMNIKSEEFKQVIKTIGEEEEKIFEHPLYDSPDGEHLYNTYKDKIKLEQTLAELKKQLEDQLSSSFLHELKCRKHVLRRLEYCTGVDVIQQKGKVACELSSGHELLLTELIFNGVFSDLSPQQIVALLSCLLCDDKSNTNPRLTADLSGPLSQMQNFARTIARVSTECMVELDEKRYVQSLKPFLMDVCFAWANGSPFTDVCKLTDIFEGSIIRCLRRMEEMLRELIQASKSIGNTELQDKFYAASNAIKRDIVFAPSLYL